MAKHNEWAFESTIEAHLLAHGWLKGSAAAFNRDTAVDANHALAFIQATQPELWAELKKQHAAGLETTLLDWLVKALNDQGTLHVLRHGFKFYGKLVKLAYFRPTHALNPDLLEKCAKNRLVVTRQVHMDPKSELSVDMVLFLNGLPIATVELKNPLTGQNINHSMAQYKDRDPNLPLFQFKKRALVHFAVDPDVAFMTTRLAGKETFFLPFNRGHHNGAGNPPDPSGHRTAYLWEEVWERESFLDIIGRFMHLTTEEKQVAGKVVTKETVIFPRYHQLDAVRRLEAAAGEQGPGHNYLVQHSAGSGKSNSIAWLAYRLSELHKNDKRVFDSVIVVTDRNVLDKQLQDTIYQFEHKQGVVVRVDQDSQQLAEAVTKGSPIIITTLQKFPFAAKHLAAVPNRSYALILDEAHSSQGGEASQKMKETLRVKDLEDALEKAAAEEEQDFEDEIEKVMAARGRQQNLSFFAFTATPKAKTLEVFGRKDQGGKPRPFHLYSMRQAIEEGFILDVLRGYSTYKTYWNLVKAATNDPLLPKRETAAILARFVSLHPHNVAQKTEVMVEHFRKHVKHKIGGRAKAMVVTASRLHAVRYRQAFEKYLAEKGYKDIGVLVAFSGEVADPDVAGATFTEPKMNNGVSEKALPREFAKDGVHVLVVANKYQTGFDQPLLHTMYVDKKLAGVAAVQTLSRLNRTYPGKEDTFVLDFVNTAEEIQAAFQDYFIQTTVAESPDPKRLYELQAALDGSQVFWKSELEAFAKTFYAPAAKKDAFKDHGSLYKHLDPAVDRFKALDEDAQDEFRTSMTGYLGLYGVLSQIMPFQDSDLEKLYSFLRFLQKRLPADPKKHLPDIGDDVKLSHYRMEMTLAANLHLADADGEVFGITEAGSKKSKPEMVKLSQVIDVLNDRFGTEFSKPDQLFFDSVIEQAKSGETVKAQANANSLENFSLAMKAKVQDAIIDRMGLNEKIAARYLNDAQFGELAFKEMVRRIYEELRAAEGG
jgi:type I restriction enzyme R subunit